MRIVQITDTHIVAKGSHWLSDPSTQTEGRLSRAIARINQLAPDAVILSGDATDDGSPASYKHLKELLAPLEAPLFLTPGNHDDRDALRTAFSLPEGFIQYTVDAFPVRLLCLDSHIPGEAGGLLCDQRLDWLEAALQTHPEKPTLLFLHHPPVKTGMKCFDKILLAPSPRFESLVQRHPQILALLCGHYHHLCISTYGSKLCYLAPSVAPVHYFAHPDDDEPAAIELDDPAITLHQINSSTLSSQVLRLNETPRRLDWSRKNKSQNSVK